MPLNPSNQRTFHRHLYAGMLQKITLLKRNDDQAEGTVTAYTLYEARRSKIYNTGQQLQGDMRTRTMTTWFLFRVELDRLGISYINTLDRIVDWDNRFWAPETHQGVTVQLFEDVVRIECRRIDPPDNPVPAISERSNPLID